MTTKTSLRSIARLLLLIGGIILILGSSPDRCGSPRSLGLHTASPISRHLHKRNSKRTGRDHSSGGSRTSPQPRLEHHPADLRIPVNWKPWWYTGLYRRLNCTSRDVCLNVHS